MVKKKVTILGAGITGLFCALKLSEDFEVTLIEKSSEIGGMSHSFKYKNFTLDYGPHKIYTELPGIINEIDSVIPLNKIKKVNSIYLEGSYFDFPLKLSQLLTRIPLKGFQAGVDVMSNMLIKKPNDNYENFLINNFGYTIYNLVFRKYAIKIWGNPKELDVDLAKKRVAVSNIFQLVKSILFKDNSKISAEYFYYPEISISQFTNSIKDKIIANGGKILLHQEIISIKENHGFFVYLKNKKIKSDYLISTIPLIDLVSYLGKKELVKEASQLKYKDLNIFYFILNKEKALKENWIFFPELNLPFNRISEQKSFSLRSCPERKTAIMVETTLSQTYKEEIRKKLIQLRIVNPAEVEDIFVKKLEKAYPIYSKGYKHHLNIILLSLDKSTNLYTLGRHGLFNYNNMDQCVDMAIKLAEQIKQGKSREDWNNTLSYFEKYRIVD
ncbi:MAG: FAD-dependent oxidoreductase [archaeon]|nr:FAD-dependent oxidoreductase [archaeon]